MNRKLLIIFLLVSFISLLGCGSYRRAYSGPSTSTPFKDTEGSNRSTTTENDIIFSIGNQTGTVVGTDIAIIMPFGTNLTKVLTPTIIIPDGASISPESGVSQNFTDPVMYTLTLVDGSIKNYTVAVSVTTEPHVYTLREIGPAGGIIFYDKGSYSDGWRYLEAAPSDQSNGIQWFNGIYTAVIFGGTGLSTTSTAVGTGSSNTDKIVLSQGDGNYAAKLCYDLVSGGFSDWFLPSRDELNLMYINLRKGLDEHNTVYTPVGNFAKPSDSPLSNVIHYWSSSEVNGGYSSWNQLFDSDPSLGLEDGGLWVCDRANPYIYVRAIRAF